MKALLLTILAGIAYGVGYGIGKVVALCLWIYMAALQGYKAGL